MFSVALKPGHPTGVRHRAGLVFSASAPTLLETVPDAVRKDSWLVVSEVAEPVVKQKQDESPNPSRRFKGSTGSDSE